METATKELPPIATREQTILELKRGMARSEEELSLMGKDRFVLMWHDSVLRVEDATGNIRIFGDRYWSTTIRTRATAMARAFTQAAATGERAAGGAVTVHSVDEALGLVHAHNAKLIDLINKQSLS